MPKYYPTIGLEIHAELKTKTKMFCACKNDPDEERPNINICPVCMAHPGALPAPNKKAIEHVIRVGLAVGGNIADFTEFDRKNYFYPDIPKGYQISQYKYPIVSGGHLEDFDITRVHLEEDTANNKHIAEPYPWDRASPIPGVGPEGYSLIDFNRAGVPLMELVTEPHTFEDPETAASEATKFAKSLQLILWYLGASEANMEKGEMRVEANISISPDKNVLGTKVEVKNLNSFRSVERAIKYEVERMMALYEEGKAGDIMQETRGWDEAKQQTFSQRKKESSQDYRYFPDPDLPKMKLHEAFDIGKMRQELPELPEAKRNRYIKEFGIKEEDVEMYINNPNLGLFFENVCKDLEFSKEKIKIASNYLTSDLQGLKNKDKFKFSTTYGFSELVNMIFNSEISSRGAKDILATMIDTGESPKKIAEEKGLLQVSDEGAIKKIAEKIIAENTEAVSSYKSGKENALMSLVGKVIKESKGSANPQLTIKILKELLK